jgi:outer membrane protein OmpA-like peptidoglycan-associated protein
MMRAMRQLTAVVALGLLVACTPTREDRVHPPQSFFVFFAIDSADLSDEAKEVIDRIADEARRIQATGVGIVGYASPAGTPSHNLRLSDLRATAVEVALLSRGVPKEIVVRTYHGATPIIGPEIEGQRVEIVVSREDPPKQP